ncbi:YcfA family protein [Desulfofarcimen acetoxidans DSM 771]|uniref:YcfA family protein n=1 Tax=Desulfofarcimen acetoxidans (strain ATCC 49208 / DSM 771 / KCTC 5769 / VKM B-1644 / 5575) TaxID=485916 RepID=C8VXH3_DESAS|nr:toxin HicA [Desulfofarcimen acetoxidans]ACV64569.1 YcfA family protein [Desulfofarcimen acetoxidans DSM 771]
MGKLEKLLKKIKNNPKAMRFEELDKILIRTGFNRRQPRKGSSHYIYSKGSKRLTVPFDEPHIKTIYVELAINLLKGEINND